MSPVTMNPGFILPNDLIDFDRPLDNALINLMVRKYPMLISKESVRRRQPGREDKIRIALVDLTGRKICQPGYAGWGSTQLMSGASTAKIALFYASHQLLCDLRELARTKSLRRIGDLLREADIAFAGIKCKPNLSWLFTFDEGRTPVGVEKSGNLNTHLSNITNEVASTLHAAQLMLRLGFEYIASVLWQSGLHHPTRQGLWLGSTFCTGRRNVRPDPRCHFVTNGGCGKGADRVVWQKDPLKMQRVVLTALSVATFFTLLAQKRLVTGYLSSEIEALLRTACTWIPSALPSATIRAAKCGLTTDLTHDAAIIENGTRRYVLVYLTQGANMPDTLRDQLVGDLDTLIRNNNPP
jgi:hypothetical protein